MPTGGGAYVRQVKPLCICMIIQGVLEILMGLGLFAMALFVPAIMNQQGGGPQMPAEQLQVAKLVVWITYGVGGGVAIIAGILRITAGIRGLYFRSYGMGLASHFVGLLSLMTCYCLPTSLGLCIWGCIVYFNSDVKHAFKLGRNGQSPAEIETSFFGR